MATWTLGGTPLAPLDISCTEHKIGVLHTHLDGSRFFAQRVDASGNPITKREWQFRFPNASKATLDAIRVRYRQTGTLTLIDEYGSSVLATPDPTSLRWERTHLGRTREPRYTVDLTVWEC